MRAACWGSGLDSSPLLRLACLQAGRRQHCQPRQVRKKAAVTAAAGCPAHKSRERGNVRGFLRLQQAIWQGAFLGEGSPLISAVDARKAPSSLTGTALRAAIRSLLVQEAPSPHSLPGALYRNAGAGASRDTAWWPLRSGIRPDAPRQAPRPLQAPVPCPGTRLQAARQFTGTAPKSPTKGNSLSCKKTSIILTKYLPERPPPKTKRPCRRTGKASKIFMSRQPSGT